MAIARMRRACLASAVRAASAGNHEIRRSWRVISIADMLPAPRINDILHRVTIAAISESPRSQVLGRLISNFDWDSQKRFPWLWNAEKIRAGHYSFRIAEAASPARHEVNGEIGQ
jgi:hypothetical protein